MKTIHYFIIGFVFWTIGIINIFFNVDLVLNHPTFKYYAFGCTLIGGLFVGISLGRYKNGLK